MTYKQVTIGDVRTDQQRALFAARLNKLLDDNGIAPKGRGRQLEISKTFGVTQNGARKWLEGEGVPELTRAMEIAQRFGVCVEWLMTGRGPVHPPSTPTQSDELSALQRRYLSCDDATRALIELCLDLPVSVPLPANVSPTLKNLLNGARLLAEQNLQRA